MQRVIVVYKEGRRFATYVIVLFHEEGEKGREFQTVNEIGLIEGRFPSEPGSEGPDPVDCFVCRESLGVDNDCRNNGGFSRRVSVSDSFGERRL